MRPVWSSHPDARFLCSPTRWFTFSRLMREAEDHMERRRTLPAHFGARERAKCLGLGALALLILVLVSCRQKQGDDAPRPPSLSVKAAKESERAKDELWQRALAHDAIDLARLADREGAGGLLLGLEEGGAIGLAALEALPFADDAEAAYQRLGEIVRQIDPVETGPVVRAISEIALRPRRQTEPLDPPGLRACADALLNLANKKDLAKSVRAPAISALRLLAERGAIRFGAVPTDLDPK